MKLLTTIVVAVIAIPLLLATATLANQPIRAKSKEKSCEFVVEYKTTIEFPFTKEIVRECKPGDEKIENTMYDRKTSVTHLIVKE